MTLEERVFEKTKIVYERLESCGFRKMVTGEGVGNPEYVLESDLMDGAFRTELRISGSGHVSGTVIDTMTEEEYFPIRIESGMGGYVNMVREEYRKFLEKVADLCGVPLPFASGQANRLTEKILEKYGEKPDFPWEGENASAGVFRNPENDKWYALVMNIEESRLTKNASDTRRVDIVNLKIREEEGETLRAKEGIFPAWHMNHRTWISVRLDDSVADEEILRLIEVSRNFTLSQRARRRASGERKSWIIPANPKYYDVVSDFDVNEYSTWRQGKGVEAGDWIYLYVGVPYQAILYRCEVLRAHLPRNEAVEPGVKEYIEIRIVDRYEKDKYQRKGIMAEFGVTNVRGPRSMPEELEKYILGDY